MLKVSGLCKSYPGFRLDHVSFSLEPGRITGLIGRNGAGKSTTLKSLLGYVQPEAGEISFFGGSTDERRVRQDIGYAAGGFGFYPRKKLRTLTQVIRSFYDNWDEKTYQQCLRRFRLDENKTPAQLSEGMKVKYALTVALSHRAKLLILDEPTSGLDPVSRDELLDVFLTLQQEGATILFSTHIISDLERCADRIIWISEGRIRADEDANALRHAYRLVQLTDAQKQTVDASLLIGARQEKAGWTALVRAENAAGMPETKPADLTSVMVYLEREAMACSDC